MLDIALLKLSTTFDMSPGMDIATIKMNSKINNAKLIGKNIEVSGWGRTERSPDAVVPNMMKTKQPIVETTAIYTRESEDESESASEWNYYNKERYLQGSQYRGRGICHGDSGGKKAYMNITLI